MIFFKKLPPMTCRLLFNRGFTVMELLVVMAIMGILYTVVMSSVGDSRSKGRDSKRIADISLIQLILEKYYDEYSKYPNSLSELSSSYDSSVPEKDSQEIDYKYAALNSDKTSCSDKCQFYHLGVSLENNNSVLDDDEDLKITPITPPDFDGTDNTTGLFVYDVIPKF